MLFDGQVPLSVDDVPSVHPGAVAIHRLLLHSVGVRPATVVVGGPAAEIIGPAAVGVRGDFPLGNFGAVLQEAQRDGVRTVVRSITHPGLPPLDGNFRLLAAQCVGQSQRTAPCHSVRLQVFFLHPVGIGIAAAVRIRQMLKGVCPDIGVSVLGIFRGQRHFACYFALGCRIRSAVEGQLQRLRAKALRVTVIPPGFGDRDVRIAPVGDGSGERHRSFRRFSMIVDHFHVLVRGSLFNGVIIVFLVLAVYFVQLSENMAPVIGRRQLCGHAGDLLHSIHAGLPHQVLVRGPPEFHCDRMFLGIRGVPFLFHCQGCHSFIGELEFRVGPIHIGLVFLFRISHLDVAAADRFGHAVFCLGVGVRQIAARHSGWEVLPDGFPLCVLVIGFVQIRIRSSIQRDGYSRQGLPRIRRALCRILQRNRILQVQGDLGALLAGRHPRLVGKDLGGLHVVGRCGEEAVVRLPAIGVGRHVRLVVGISEQDIAAQIDCSVRHLISWLKLHGAIGVLPFRILFRQAGNRHPYRRFNRALCIRSGEGHYQILLLTVFAGHLDGFPCCRFPADR